jgi:hypothetical protein
LAVKQFREYTRNYDIFKIIPQSKRKVESFGASLNGVSDFIEKAEAGICLSVQNMCG